MPAATTAITKMASRKRKAEPGKFSSMKESKKTKIEMAAKSSPQKNEKIQKPKSKPAKHADLSDESESEGSSDESGSEGGAPLFEVPSDKADVHGNLTVNANTNSKDGVHPERIKAAVAISQSSKESHMKQKQLAQERKAAKPLAEQLARTKKIWERLRRKSHVPRDERKELVTELFEITTGRIKDFVLKHDSVRVVQTAIKYANPEQKRMISKELAGTYRQLAESKYAKFLIGKLLVHADNEIRDIIVPEFFGHVRRLIKHPEASWILDDIYRGAATKEQKAVILREWYGAEFALFKDIGEPAPAELSEILKTHPEKRVPIMRSLLELINHLIQKKMTGFTLLHDAMLQYFINAKSGTEEINEYVELIKGDEEGDLLKNLAFTKSGARVVCLALAYSNAKDRKQILKTYKDTLQLVASDPNGHIIILTAYEVIDDTVLTAKSIFPELLGKEGDKQRENVVMMANDLNARTTILYLYQGRSRALFPASHNSDLEILAEVDVIRASTSKKDAELRRAELSKVLSQYLLAAIEGTASELVTTSFGCQVITEVLFGADGDKSATLTAVARCAAGDPNTPQPLVDGDVLETSGVEAHLGSTAWGGKMLKALVAGGRFDSKIKAVVPVTPALKFADILFPYIMHHLVEWATGSSSFVVLALLECPNFSRRGEMVEILNANKEKLQKASKEETASQKASREAFEAKSVGDGPLAFGLNGKNPKAAIKEREIGNRGTTLLLEKLL